MPENSKQSIFDQGEPKKRASVKWDKKIQSKMAQRAASGGETSATISSETGSARHAGMKQLVRRIAVKVLKGPMLRIREFMNTPLSIRLDGVSEHAENNAAIQQQLISEYEHRLEKLERVLDEVTTLQTDVGYLHKKADESMLKSRPVVKREGAYAVPLADGYIFIPEEEENLLLMYTGATSAGLEPGVRHIMQSVLEPGDFAIDVGASVGLHTLALARAVGAGGHVEAFEAETRLEPVLRRTFAVNGLAQVTLHQLAVGAKNGTATFHVAQTIGHSSLYDLGGDDPVREKVRVSLKKLDSLIEKSVAVNLIKIDVEGAELDVIRGAKRVLKNSPECVIVAECGPSHLQRTGTSVEDWFGEFAAHGFEPYGITEPDGQLHELNLQWVATQYSVNVVFLRPGSRIEDKLFNRMNLLQERN